MTETMRRSGAVNPGTFDETAMTIEAVLSSFADVRRNGFVERLDPAGLDTSRLVGAPLLNAHRAGDGRDVIGTVTAVRIENGDLVGTIRLSLATDVAPLVQRIREGSLRGVSLGYRVSRWVDSIDPSSGQRVRTAAAWQPFEASAVPVAADPRATFRSHEMTTENEQTGIETPMPPENADAPRIRALAEVAGLTTEWADDIVRRGLDLEDARLSAQAELMRRSAAQPRIRAHVGPSHDDPSEVHRRMADALAYRMAGGGEPAPEVRAYLADPVTDLMKRSLELAGVSTRGLSRDDIMARAMNTTSDFPLVVSNAMGKVALDAYKAAETPLKLLCKSRNLTNFKESTAIRLGGMGRLEEVSESGEIKHTSRAENGEGLRLKTFARGIDVSRRLLIDDDLGLLGDMTSALGTAAGQTEADLLVDTLLGNGKLSDGKAVFHSSRGNISDPSGLAVTALGDSRKAMRKRTDLDGKTLVNGTPKYLLVGPELEDWAERVLAEIYPSTADGVNPFTGKLQLLVEPRITDSRWYVFSDPARLPCLQYAHLASAPGVQIQRTEAWDVLGTKYRAWLDFGVGWLDWRGAQFNAGAA